MKLFQHSISYILLILVLATACGSKAETPQCPIRVGIIVREDEEEKLNGYHLALTEINGGGGVSGCQLELVIIDDGRDVTKAQVAVKDMALEYELPLIIGASTSTTTIAASGAAEAYKIPFIVPTASSNFVTERGLEWVFRINASSSDYADASLDFVQDKLGASAKIAIIFEQTTFGESAAVSLTSDALIRGFEIVFYEGYDRGTFTDYSGLMRRLKLTEPDVIYFALNQVNKATKFMEMADILDVNPSVFIGIAGSYVNPSFLNAGEYALYVLSTAQWSTNVSWGKSNEFVQLYLAVYGEEPGMRAAQAHAALFVAKDALERAVKVEGKTVWNWIDIKDARKVLRDELAKTNLSGDNQTVLGDIRFNQKGQNNHQVIITQVIEGKFIGVYPENLTGQEAIVPIPEWWERTIKE